MSNEQALSPSIARDMLAESADNAGAFDPREAVVSIDDALRICEAARPSPARDDFEIDTPLSIPLEVVRTQPRHPDAARDKVLEEAAQVADRMAAKAKQAGEAEAVSEVDERYRERVDAAVVAELAYEAIATGIRALKAQPPSTVGEDAHWASDLGGLQEALRVLRMGRASLLDQQRQNSHIKGVYEAPLAALEPALAELNMLVERAMRA